MEKEKIKFDFVRTNYLTRWTCDLCGGCTEKVNVLTEVIEGDEKGLRVCERCLEAGQSKVNDIMRLQVMELKAEAERISKLIGRVVLPSYADWLVAEDQAVKSIWGDTEISEDAPF